MKCDKCEFEIEWSCSIKSYETENKKCPKCIDGYLVQNYSQHKAGFVINGYSAANNYGLKN